MISVLPPPIPIAGPNDYVIHRSEPWPHVVWSRGIFRRWRYLDGRWIDWRRGHPRAYAADNGHMPCGHFGSKWCIMPPLQYGTGALP